MLVSELKDKICEEYKYKIELHAHTSPESGCSQIKPCDMAKFYHEHGYAAIVITNHFIYNEYLFRTYPVDEATKLYLKGYEETKKEAEKYGLTVLLGAEIRFTENFNDYMIYGVNEKMLTEIYNLLPYGVENFRKNYKMEDSVFIQAHPFRDGIERINPELLDGVETFNMHPGHNSRIAYSARYAKKYGFKIMTTGSDFHHYGMEAVSAVRTKKIPKDSFELAKILKECDYVFEIGENSIVLP